MMTESACGDSHLNKYNYELSANVLTRSIKLSRRLDVIVLQFENVSLILTVHYRVSDV